jgi:hypothetical protein
MALHLSEASSLISPHGITKFRSAGSRVAARFLWDCR